MRIICNKFIHIIICNYLLKLAISFSLEIIFLHKFYFNLMQR